MARDFDFVIVGGGSAGSAPAKLAAERAAAALCLPLEVREVGDAGLERALAALLAG